MTESCPHCGRLNDAEHAFCGQCGTSLDAPTPPEPHQWMKNTAPPRRVVPRPQPNPKLFPCPDCGHDCSKAALACPQCGRPLLSARQQRPPAPPPQQVLPPPQMLAYQPPPPQYINHYYPPRQLWNPGVAGLLSFILPGAGQIYKGNVGAGILWFFLVAVGYGMLILPGLILHVVCIYTAASGNTYRRGG